MNEQLAKELLGRIAGLELAIAHLANVVGNKAGLTKEQMALSFEEVDWIEDQPFVFRPQVESVLKHIAEAIRASDWPPLRLIASTPEPDNPREV